MARAVPGLAIVLGLALAPSPASPHEQWANGAYVPSWIKSTCCGLADAHHLRREQVHAMRDGWHIDNYPYTLSYGRELPSQDGDYWLFYAHDELGYSPAYCFFAPPEGY